MATDKKYSGYKSFQYLQQGVDYKDFELAEQVDRVESYKMELSEEDEKRAERILEDDLIISLHDHLFIAPKNTSEIFRYNREGRSFTAYEGLSISAMDAVFENFMDGTCTITSKMGWKWSDVIYDVGMRMSDWAHQELITKCEKLDDIIAAREEGKVAVIPCLESSTMIENEVDRLDILYGLGIRSMGIVYSESNALGSGLKESRDGGLTQFGCRAVERMNKLGIAIDVSHAGDVTSLETIEASEKPIFITHSGARELWDSARLKPDEVLLALADNGGVVGIEAAPHTTITKTTPEHGLESFMEHFEYCVDLLGIDHVAFGPDTLYGDHVGIHDAFAEHLSISAAHGGKDFPKVDYVEGLENPSETFPNIVKWLVKHGYSNAEIEKVLSGNVLRVLEQAWY